jgi:hypothetical protein|tara:strand:+ start:3779 stop:4072 length:294 start_codon:yes stop_codon:yes gene_type:complete
MQGCSAVEDICRTVAGVVAQKLPAALEFIFEVEKKAKPLLMTGYAENEIFRTRDGEPKYPVLKKPFTKEQIAKAINHKLNKNAAVFEVVYDELTSQT